MASLPAPDAFIRDPHRLYQQLRDSSPVLRVDLPDGAPAWLVTRYADVRALLTDSRLSLDKANGDGSWKGYSLPPALDANLLNMDPPNHTRIRKLVTQAFTTRRVRASARASSRPPTPCSTRFTTRTIPTSYATTRARAALRRYPGLRLAVPDDEIRWRPSFRTRGLIALPVLLA